MATAGTCTATDPKIGVEITRADERLSNLLNVLEGAAVDICGADLPPMDATQLAGNGSIFYTSCDAKPSSQNLRAMVQSLHFLIDRLERQTNRIRSAV